MNPAIDLLKESNTANIMSDRLTIEYVEEKLSKGFPLTNITAGNITVGTDASALIYAPELSVFIRRNSEALSDLASLWDNKSMEYGTRGKGLYPIKDPCVSLLGGSAPRWLAKSIPNDAVGGGFTRRVNFAYTKNDPTMPTWDIGQSFNGNGNNQVYSELIEDMRYIATTLHGPITNTPAFRDAFNIYSKSITFDAFDDEATTSFKASKWTNTVKLAMVLCASRTDSGVMDAPDLIEAISYVDKVEQSLQLVFRSVGESDDATAGALLLEYIEKRGKTTLADIMRALWRHVNREDAQRLLAMFVETNMIREASAGGKTMYTFNLPTPQEGVYIEDEQIKVLEFHQTFGLTISDKPTLRPNADRMRCINLIEEELHELIKASVLGDLVGIADGLADLVYVIKGMAVSYGIDLEHVFKEVHRSNMTKIGGKINSWGKLVKPLTYEPANIKAVLEQQGLNNSKL